VEEAKFKIREPTYKFIEILDEKIEKRDKGETDNRDPFLIERLKN